MPLNVLRVRSFYFLPSPRSISPENVNFWPYFDRKGRQTESLQRPRWKFPSGGEFAYLYIYIYVYIFPYASHVKIRPIYPGKDNIIVLAIRDPLTRYRIQWSPIIIGTIKRGKARASFDRLKFISLGYSQKLPFPLPPYLLSKYSRPTSTTQTRFSPILRDTPRLSTISHEKLTDYPACSLRLVYTRASTYTFLAYECTENMRERERERKH